MAGYYTAGIHGAGYSHILDTGGIADFGGVSRTTAGAPELLTILTWSDALILAAEKGVLTFGGFRVY